MADRIRRYSYPRDSGGEISHYCSNQQSFSSTLLDAIYREIDRGDQEDIAAYRKKKVLVDEKVTSVPAAEVNKLRKSEANSSSSSVDFGHGRGFYSIFKGESFPIGRPKAVRPGGMEIEIHGDREINYREMRGNFRGDGSEEKTKNAGGVLKTKSRALKLYGELKKVKQPISPGGKLAGLWNSLLSRKPKLTGGGDDSPSLKSATTNTSSSTCTSASSFSKSCLSKTSSSRGKTSGGEKRSVRFFPVSVIVDEDCQPCGHKALNEDSRIKTAIDEDQLMIHIKNYQKKSEIIRQVELPFHQTTKPHANNNQRFEPEEDDDEDDDEFDRSTESSSDLFELDNLSAIGMDHKRYVEELPVYETTDLQTNRAIANTFLF